MKQTSKVNPGAVPAIQPAAVIAEADLRKVSGGGGAGGGVIGKSQK